MRIRHLTWSHTVLTLVPIAFVLASCGGVVEAPDVVVESPPDDGPSPTYLAPERVSVDATALAWGASFAADSVDTARVSPAGIELDVAARYFESIRYANWTAPEDCSFDTIVDVIVNGGELVLESPPLNGPTSDDDRDHNGQLAVAVPWELSDANEPESHLVLVVVFDHDASVTLTIPQSNSPDSPDPPLADTQPVDGWTPLATVVPAAAAVDTATIDVELSYSRQDGTQSSTSLAVPADLEPGRIANLTDGWDFDESLVDQRCAPPPEVTFEALNEPTPDVTDPLGGVIGVKPDLPEPGEQPADAETATTEALHAIRTVYDIYNLYDQSKYAFMEDPVLAEEIFLEAASLQVVEPYVGNLDPIFDSMVFTSPTEGSVLYRVGSFYNWEIGRVMLIDGWWRVALGTLCRDLSDAMYRCPDVVLDPRPGPLGN